MHQILKAIIILTLELNIYVCFGCAMGKLRFFPEVSSLGGRLINGFLGYHFVFWCMALPCTYLKGSLHFTKIVWTVIICVLLGGAGVLFHKEISRAYKDLLAALWKYKWYLIPCLALHAFILYYVCVNGQTDVDARTYIGEVTSMIDTDSLTGINPSTGLLINTIRLKRSFSMFGVNSAVLCSMFHMHPLIFCRTVRAAINIIILASVTFEIFQCVYRKYEDKREHAIMALMLAQCCLFLFTNSIYTSSSFILYRAYEGKAYCSGALVLIAIYLAVRLCGTNDRRFFLLIFIGMIAGMSLSASAGFILPLAAGSVVCAYIATERKWNYIIPMVFSFVPNIIYIMMSITGFAGFVLEG